MGDKLPARICPVPPFDDADKSVGGGCLLIALALLALASFCRYQCLKQPPNAEAEQVGESTN